MKNIEWINCVSSQIKRFAYDLELRTLSVQFNDGATFNYAGVPPENFEGLKSAASKGKFINANIKGKYVTHRSSLMA